jgi:hypothetical protein
MLNTQLPRFNARWRDPRCEDVDCLRLPDAAWRRENNYYNPPWTAISYLAAKLNPWGAVLNERLEAPRLWIAEDEQEHITWKKLKTVRHAFESFLPELAGSNVLMQEDNHAACHILTCLTSRSPVMMDELRRLLRLLDTKSINLLAHYIRSRANVQAAPLTP